MFQNNVITCFALPSFIYNTLMAENYKRKQKYQAVPIGDVQNVAINPQTQHTMQNNGRTTVHVILYKHTHARSYLTPTHTHKRTPTLRGI